MEAARLLAQAGARPERTIVFALWAGEEFGLLGSTAWVEQHPDKLPGILNFFNRDGGPTVANSLTVPPVWYEMLEPVVPVLNAVNPDFPFTLQVSDRYPVKRPETAGGSDHAPFVVRGVPVLSFGTADPKGYDFQYREIWHTDRDRYDKSIPEYMEHTAVVNAVMLWFIANLPERLPAGAVYLPE